MKYVITFFLSLVLGLSLSMLKLSSASAVSSNIVIMQLQTAGPVTGTASEEIIVLYNSSAEDVNITGWCLEYSAAANGVSFTKLGCVDPIDTQTEIWVSAGGYVTFSTNEFNLKNTGFVTDFVFGAGLAATGGHLRLADSDKQEIDRVSWGNAVTVSGVVPAIKHADGKVLSRNSSALQIDTDVNLDDFSSMLLINPIISGVYEVEIKVDICPNIVGLQLELPSGFMSDDSGDCYQDSCSNIDNLQVIIPEGYEVLIGSSDCTEIPLEDAIIFITELVANAPSTDTGNEFIEIYNPLKRVVNLSGYKLQVGPSFTKQYIFKDSDILPGQYRIFSDSETSIVLPNTSGVQLRLVTPSGNVVSESDIYSSAGDDVSWALVDDQWIYTNQITPGSANKPYLQPAVDEVIGVTSIVSPCTAGKYRNPETNRCRNIETAVSQLTPCAEDEYRNTTTNRCRKVYTAPTLSACAAGQERSPETNRCRKVSVLGASTDALPTVTDVAVANTSGHINWAVIAAVLTGTFAYIIYEWRSELSHLYGSTRSKLVQ